MDLSKMLFPGPKMAVWRNLFKSMQSSLVDMFSATPADVMHSKIKMHKFTKVRLV